MSAPRQQRLARGAIVVGRHRLAGDAAHHGGQRRFGRQREAGLSGALTITTRSRSGTQFFASAFSSASVMPGRKRLYSAFS